MCLFHFSIVCGLVRGHSPSFNSAISLSILNVILLVVAELFHAISFIWSCFMFWGLILLSEHSCVVGEGSFGFHPSPIFQLLSLTLERLWLSQSPSNRAHRSWGALLRGASISLPVSHHLLLAGLRDSLFLLIQATRIFGHRTNLCPIFCFLLSMTLLWKQIPFLKLLFILSAFMSSAIMFKKVSGTACVSMKSSSRSSDP